jgi:hypothetical protein
MDLAGGDTPLKGSPQPASARVLEWVAANRTRWLVVGTLLCALLPPLFSWPELPPMPAAGHAYWSRYWDDVLKLKVDHPAYDYTRDFPPASNPAKRNFRLTVPLAAHASGLGMAAVPFIRYVLQGVLLVGLLLAGERACGDRIAALGAALAVAGTYVGTSVWMDEWHWFDNCAQAFMVLALLARRPAWAFAALLAAAFTDERALVAAPLIALFHFWTGGRRSLVWASFAAVAAYIAARIALSMALGLHNPAGAIGAADTVFPNLRVLPLGVWGAIEGGWFLVAAACAASLRAGDRRSLMLLAAAVLLPVAASVFVIDFSKSASYAFPAVFAALALWAASVPAGAAAPRRPLLRRWAALAAAVSLLAPNFFIMGRTFVQPSVLFLGLSGLLHSHP